MSKYMSIVVGILKAFDKAWYEGLISQLKENGISVNLFNIITDFMNLGKQRVVLNGQFTSWTDGNTKDQH